MRSNAAREYECGERIQVEQRDGHYCTQLPGHPGDHLCKHGFTQSDDDTHRLALRAILIAQQKEEQ